MKDKFLKAWQSSTDDNNITLHGFRRCKTTPLLNLRFLEDKMADLDQIIYQASLNLGLSDSPADRRGLTHSKRDAKVPNINDTITTDFILNLRELLRQYNEALVAFNRIMAMETFSLLDDEKHSGIRNDLSLYEIYKTRLLRVDLETRSGADPFQHWLHRYLRAFRYWRLSRKSRNNRKGLGAFTSGHHWSYQNTVYIADILGRVTTAIVTGIFLVAPLAILSHESSKDIQLIVISVSIVIWSFLVSLVLKISSFEITAISAVYAAVLSVFVSNVSDVVT